MRRRRDRWGSYFAERWLPQLRSGGVDIQVLPVFVDDAFRPEGALRESLRMVEAAQRLAADNHGEVALCLTGSDVVAAVAGGRIALVLALEGCPQIESDVELLQVFQRLGVRVVSFTHFGRSALEDGSAEDAAGSRLTRAGVEAVGLLEELGVMVDLSHFGRAGVEHVLELAGRPVIATIQRRGRRRPTPGATSEEIAEIKALKAENRRLREDVEIFRGATTFFVGELER